MKSRSKREKANNAKAKVKAKAKAKARRATMSRKKAECFGLQGQRPNKYLKKFSKETTQLKVQIKPKMS
jgi:hypothetical protein